MKILSEFVEGVQGFCTPCGKYRNVHLDEVNGGLPRGNEERYRLVDHEKGEGVVCFGSGCHPEFVDLKA